MRKYKFSLVFLLFFLVTFSLRSQEIIKNSEVTGVCYAGNKVNRIYIPPPESYFKKSDSKGGASIKFYYTGFSPQAIEAMEKARAIIASMLPADTKMTILASWEKISTSGVLANTVVTGYAAGWGIDALNPLAYYPVALAEKIAGESLNPDLQGDMELRVNSSINWYLSTDGNTPVNQYDLVTVVIHEICHGLGFFDSMDTDATLGYYGFGSMKMPMIYDTFLESVSGSRLTDTLKFLNPSTSLRTQLIGGQLWFNGPLLSNYTNGTKVKLYAPSTWDPGSSASHLDESATLDENGLMTPFIDKGEAIHDPGKLTLSILGDLGWVNTRIVHTPIKDTEIHMDAVPLSIEIVSDTLYNRNKVGVVYSFDEFNTIDTLYLTSPSSDNNFSTSINITSYNTDLQYYFFVEDYFLRMYRSPSFFELFRYNVYIGTDTVKPLILHTPADYYLEKVDTINFEATAIDNIGVDTVYVEYKINEGSLNYIGLKKTGESYKASLKAKFLNLNGGDSIKYRIFAVDSALAPNTGILPEVGFFAVGIEDIKDVVESYSTDFSNANNDFLKKGFEIIKPANFSRNGLHSIHPYESPESNDETYDYFAMLRSPIKLNESGLFIRYNEIVLVEPGETGSVFGSDDFYDYVIVEGSKDFGKSWFGFEAGYDSRYISSWLSAYNSSIVNQNSTTIGTESMLKKHSLYYRPSDNISANDTLMVRFRLFSDPYANGWGWVIEDLKINPLIDDIRSPSEDQLALYPNPGKGLINLIDYRSGSNNERTLRFSVFSSSGICLVNNQKTVGNEMLVDISSYPTGIYIIVLYRDDGIKTFKYSLIK